MAPNPLGDEPLVAREDIDEALLRWLSAPGSPYLHVKGPPGSGKSVWAQMLGDSVGLCGTFATPLALVAAKHVCRRGDSASASGHVFLERVALQLCRFDANFDVAFRDSASGRQTVIISVNQSVSASPGAEVAAVKVSTLSIRAEDPGDLLEALLLKPLREVLSGPGPIWLIVVDAPDEPAGSGVADLLVSLGALPERLRVVVTSRPDTEFACQFEAVNPAIIDLTQLGAEHAIMRYVQLRADATGLAARLASQWTIADLARRISERAGDNFLVARCMVDALETASGQLFPAMIASLPTKLADLYKQFLLQLPGDVRRNWPEQTGRLLGALAVAREPLSEADLAAVCDLPGSVVRARLALVRQYLAPVQDGDAWRIFHATFAEFLLDARQADRLWCPAEEQHRRFVKWALPQGSVPDWTSLPRYPLTHLIHHLLASQPPNLARVIDRAICEGYVAARLAHGEAPFDLARDFGRAVRGTAPHGDVPLTLFLTLLLQFWNDRAAADADPAWTTLLAASGRLEEAVGLALGQDAAAHATEREALFAQTEFVRRLILLGERGTALAFVEQAPEGVRRDIADAMLDALACIADDEAMVLLRDPNFGSTPRHLGLEACRNLAGRRDGTAIAQAAAGRRAEAKLAVAQGIAAYDVDSALTLAGGLDHENHWLGGEKLSFGADYGWICVLSAFLDAHPRASRIAWMHADRLLGRSWRNPYGLILAGDLAASDPTLVEELLPRLGKEDSALHQMLYRAWIGARVGVPIAAPPAWRIPTGRSEEERAEYIITMASFDLSSVLPQLAVIDPMRFKVGSDAFAQIGDFATLLLRALAFRPNAPESKHHAAKPLARLFAWLGDDLLQEFWTMAEARWRQESWSFEAGVGAAEGLASRGIDAYLGIDRLGIREVGTPSALDRATAILAEREPADAIRLFELIPAAQSATRARVAGIVGMAMRANGKGRPKQLESFLNSYVDSARFAEATATLAEVICGAPRTAEPSPVDTASAALDSAIASGASQDRLLAAAAIAEIPRGVGFPVDGAFVYADGMRRRFAAAFLDSDPRLALQVLLPAASLKEIRSLAAALIRHDPTLTDPAELAAVLLEAAEHVDRQAQSAFWNLYAVLGFALELPPEARSAFYGAACNTSLADLIEKACTAIKAPEIILDHLTENDAVSHRTDQYAATEHSRDIGETWLLGIAVRQFAQTNPHQALARVDALPLGDVERRARLVDVALSWPIERWCECLDSFLARIRSADDTRYWTFEFIVRPVAARAAAMDFGGVLEKACAIGDELAPGDFERSYLVKDIVRGAAERAPMFTDWPALISALTEIREPTPLSTALGAMIAGAEKLPPAARARAAAATIAEYGLGPRETFFTALGAIARTAREAQPGMAELWPPLAQRLRAMLSLKRIPAESGLRRH